MTSSQYSSINVQRNIPLSPHTTIRLGGNAKHFVECGSVEEIRDALRFAATQNIRVQVLGGGSNTIFADGGFNGLVLRVNLKGMKSVEKDSVVLVIAAAGEEWDLLVQQCVERSLAGIECLSGIPGLVGATPIQNVGAYGQEVRDTIVTVKVLDRQTLALVEFANEECGFGYRQSRFKSVDAERYIVVEVSFRLERNGTPRIRYEELRKAIVSSGNHTTVSDKGPSLLDVRNTVLALRRRKSMVLDAKDTNSRSVGSFFMNPVLSKGAFNELALRARGQNINEEIPVFASGEAVKVPAAWLVERAGFRKGYRLGGVGVSSNHSLALVNHGGTTEELLELAAQIQRAVQDRFSVRLDLEPVVVPE